MCYAFFHVRAYTFLLTFTTFLLSLLGSLCIHGLGKTRDPHGNTVHWENAAAHTSFLSRIVRVFWARVRWVYLR
jgi:hypothetical protein